MKIKQYTPEQPVHQRRKDKEIKKYLRMNKNGKTTYYNLQDAEKIVLRGKSITMKAYIKKIERSQTT